TVLARTTTPSGSGRAGLAYPGTAPGAALVGTSRVFGLFENAEERSNLAFANAGTSPLTLKVTLRSGDGTRTSRLDDVRLAPGEWAQRNSVLAAAGLAEGYAVLEPEPAGAPYL